MLKIFDYNLHKRQVFWYFLLSSIGIIYLLWSNYQLHNEIKEKELEVRIYNENIDKTNDLDLRYSKCLDKADNDAKWSIYSYCMNSPWYPDKTACKLDELPSGGTLLESYQKDKSNCSQQFKGAIYKEPWER